MLFVIYTVVCGGILNKTSGEFQALDRNNDGLYDYNLDCHWSIVGGDNQLIELRILSIFLEEAYLCSFDYLEAS